jgi:hypothetical protein
VRQASSARREGHDDLSDAIVAARSVARSIGERVQTFAPPSSAPSPRLAHTCVCRETHTQKATSGRRRARIATTAVATQVLQRMFDEMNLREFVGSLTRISLARRTACANMQGLLAVSRAQRSVLSRKPRGMRNA